MSIIVKLAIVTSVYNFYDCDLPVLTLLRNVLFYSLFAVVLILFALMVPVALVSMRIGWPMIIWLARATLYLLRVLCGIDYQVSGRENLPSEPYLIAAGHQSMWETIFFHSLLNNPVMLAKDSLFKIPGLGAIMRKNGHVPVDRSGSIEAFRMAIAQAGHAFTAGRSILIFPQGTRANSAGSDVKLGVLVLYRKLGCACVPVVLDSGRYWPSDGGLMRAGTIKVRILPALPPGLPPREFIARITQDLETAP